MARLVLALNIYYENSIKLILETTHGQGGN